MKETVDEGVGEEGGRDRKGGYGKNKVEGRLRKGEGRRREEEGGGGREKEDEEGEEEEEEREEVELSLMVVSLVFEEIVILPERLCRRRFSLGLRGVSDFRGEEGFEEVGVLKIGLCIADLFNFL